MLLVAATVALCLFQGVQVERWVPIVLNVTMFAFMLGIALLEMMEGHSINLSPVMHKPTIEEISTSKQAGLIQSDSSRQSERFTDLGLESDHYTLDVSKQNKELQDSD